MTLDTYRSYARPTLMWVCIPLVPLATIMDGVGSDKLVPLLGFLGVLYGLRGWEKVQHGRNPTTA